MNIQSNLTTLQEIVDRNYFFRVPIYQRLYVWRDDQLKTLIADLWTAYSEHKDIFHLGGVLVVERGGDGNQTCFDLIDGQQRFTTLWMMSLVWKSALKPFICRWEKDHRQQRVSFPIRPDVDMFFTQLMDGEDPSSIANPQIVDAFGTIQSFMEERDADFKLEDFTCFIYEKVQLVLTLVPAHTDLNKLFEVINNRGMQLQHHEILKAKFLKHIADTGERERYACLWDSCSGMNSYVEKNLKNICKIKVSELFDNEASDNGEEMLASADKVLEALTSLNMQAQLEESMDLESILSSDEDISGESETGEDYEVCESDDVRSIISFPMLLQHVLRIWLFQHSHQDLPKIMDKELLELFEQNFLSRQIGYEEVTSFIGLLWEIRYCFDKHVIKWVKADEEEQHLICKLRLNQKNVKGERYYSLARQQPANNEDLALLQSMLYHSQQITTHYWLTPFLAFIRVGTRSKGIQFDFLKHLDTHLHCSTDESPLVERSRKFLSNPWHRNTLMDVEDILNKPLGLAFPHYWFYKLEFILWHQKRNEINDPRWEVFRMTAKNSIEYIWPQAPEGGQPAEWEDQLNYFGNLGLVSRSINSEYGRKPFHEKKAHFETRNKKRIDSLKMFFIYQNKEWTPQKSQQHKQEMIEQVKKYMEIAIARRTR